MSELPWLRFDFLIYVIYNLLRVYQNFISLLPRTASTKSQSPTRTSTSHKSVACSILFFTIALIVARTVNLAKLATVWALHSNAGRILILLLTDFVPDSGAIEWIVTLVLGVIVYFAVEKRRRRPNGEFDIR